MVATLLMGGLAGCSSGEGSADAPSTPAASSSAPAPSSASPSPSPSEESSAPAEDSDDIVEVSVSVRNGKVSPPPRRVKVPQGADVRLTVTSDVDDEVHVHGFEIEEPLEAGRPATIELVAGEKGLFEVETHDSGLTLLQLEVR